MNRHGGVASITATAVGRVTPPLSGRHTYVPCARCGVSTQKGRKSRTDTMCRDCRSVEPKFGAPIDTTTPPKEDA